MISRSFSSIGPLVLVLLAPNDPGTIDSVVRSEDKVTPTKAIQDGLAWLARHQNPDGSWSMNTIKDRCSKESCCCDPNPAVGFNDHYDEGVTGLALLCFLRAGFDDASKKEVVDTARPRRFKAAEIVSKGLTWLQSRQAPDGRFKPERWFLYDEAIAELAMAEACVISKVPEFRASAQKGAEFLQGAQRPSPSGEGLWGWRYEARQDVDAERPKDAPDEKYLARLHDSDISATGWAVAALVAAQRAGLNVKKEAFDGAIAFCNYVTIQNGKVGYLDPKGAGVKVTGPGDQFDYHTATMSALGMCIRLEAQRDRTISFFENAAQQMLQDLPAISSSKLSVDYYYWYEATMALNRYDGEDSGARAKKKYSGPWNKSAIEALIALQDRTKGACRHGGWVVPDRWSYTGGPIYATAINVLTLQACTRR